MKFVKPKTYLVGYTQVNEDGLEKYLKDTNNEEFLEVFEHAKQEGIPGCLALCSFYAKLCYASLTLGHNKNISKTRDIENNLKKGCIDSGHGSVLEHCQFNFVTTNCSRVFTHELVRHRVGTAFSQTSGRYVRTDNIGFVLPPDLEIVRDKVQIAIENIEKSYKEISEAIDVDNIPDMFTRKKVTSALRRILPNGMSNEMGWSCNWRNIRHIIEMRTNEHAEWEIRYICNEAADILLNLSPLTLYKNSSLVEIKDNMTQYSKIRT